MVAGAVLGYARISLAVEPRHRDETPEAPDQPEPGHRRPVAMEDDPTRPTSADPEHSRPAAMDDDATRPLADPATSRRPDDPGRP